MPSRTSQSKQAAWACTACSGAIDAPPACRHAEAGSNAVGRPRGRDASSALQGGTVVPRPRNDTSSAAVASKRPITTPAPRPGWLGSLFPPCPRMAENGGAEHDVVGEPQEWPCDELRLRAESVVGKLCAPVPRRARRVENDGGVAAVARLVHDGLGRLCPGRVDPGRCLVPGKRLGRRLIERNGHGGQACSSRRATPTDGAADSAASGAEAKRHVNAATNAGPFGRDEPTRSFSRTPSVRSSPLARRRGPWPRVVDRLAVRSAGAGWVARAARSPARFTSGGKVSSPG